MARVAEHPIEQMFLNRWSSRAMSGTPLAQQELMRLIEAARWAPSCANSQPWRFLYALAGTEHFQTFFDLLQEGNKSWCARAGALLVILSKKTFDNGKPSPTHSLDAGSAWMSLALQGSALGLVVHGMAGFDYARAASELGVPDDYRVEAMVAVGYPGDPEELLEKDRAREIPSGRRAASESIQEGRFGGQPQPQ